MHFLIILVWENFSVYDLKFRGNKLKVGKFDHMKLLHGEKIISKVKRQMTNWEKISATMNSQRNQKIIINTCSNRWINNKSWQEYSLRHKRLCNLVKMVFIPFPLSLLLQVAIYNTAYCWTLGYAILSDTDTFWLLLGLFLLHFFL